MGNMKDLMGMIPGMGKMMKDVEIGDDAFKNIEAIIMSMTPKERENPNILNGQRKKRLADGSGTNIVEVNKLIKQVGDMQKMMKQMSGGKGMAMMNAMMKKGAR
jgi:signal recognition particle subunit SRP54